MQTDPQMNPRHTGGPQRIKLMGDPPSPISPPPGCRFAQRCPVALPECSQALPELREVEPDHWVRCHRVETRCGVAQPVLQWQAA